MPKNRPNSRIVLISPWVGRLDSYLCLSKRRNGRARAILFHDYHADAGGRLMSECSNHFFVCGKCGWKFIASYEPLKTPRCPVCRKNPEGKKYVKVRYRRKNSYLPLSLKVKIK